MVLYCFKCKCVHRNKKTLKEHIEKGFVKEISKSEYWKIQFKKNWKKYNPLDHQLTNGSRKQIQKSNYSKGCCK